MTRTIAILIKRVLAIATILLIRLLTNMKYQAEYNLTPKDKQIMYSQSVNLAVESMAANFGGMMFAPEVKEELMARIDFFYSLLTEEPYKERSSHGMSKEERKEKTFEPRDLDVVKEGINDF